MTFPEHLKLTPTEKRVVEQVMTGANGRAAAASMCITYDTFQRHVHNVFNKTGFSSRTELMAYFHQLELDKLRAKVARQKKEPLD